MKYQNQFTIRTPKYLENFKPFHDTTSLNQIAKIVQTQIQKEGDYLQCLDSMAGTGIVGRKMKKIFNGLNIVYQDKSQKMLSSGIYKNDKCILSDAIKIDIPNKTFDIIFCRAGLNNVCKKNYLKILKEYIRILRDNGIIILQDHFAQNNETKIIINKIETEIANTEGRSDETYVPTVKELKKIAYEAKGVIINEQSFKIHIPTKERFKNKNIQRPNLFNIKKILKKQKVIQSIETNDDITIIYPIFTIAFKNI